MKKIEMSKQKELAKWFRTFLKPYVEKHKPHIKNLRFVYVKNEGKKNIIEATQDKNAGVEAGHPDTYISFVIGNIRYIHYLELKAGKNGLNANQKEWWAEFIPCLNSQGVVCNDFETMKKTILDWIEQANIKYIFQELEKTLWG